MSAAAASLVPRPVGSGSSRTGAFSAAADILIGRWPLIDRDRELAKFRAFLRQADGNALVLSGPPGAGKTRLGIEFLQMARGFGHPVVDLAAVASDVRTLQPEIGERASRPTAVLVDGLDRLDREQVGYLLARVHQKSIIVIGVLDQEAELSPAVLRFWRDDAVGTLDVAPLPSSSIGELLSAVFTGHLEMRTRSVLTELSGGDLALLRELIIGALSDGSLHRFERTWGISGSLHPSERLAGLVASRVAALTLDEREVAEVLAVAGGLTSECLERWGMLNAAARLESRGFARCTAGPGTDDLDVRLDNPLMARVLRCRTPRLRRRKLARRLLEDFAASAPATGRASSLAGWYVEADAGSPVELLEAAQQAFQAGDLSLAESLARRAVDLVPDFDGALWFARIRAVRRGMRREPDPYAGLATLMRDDSETFRLECARLATPSLVFSAEGDTPRAGEGLVVGNPELRESLAERRRVVTAERHSDAVSGPGTPASGSRRGAWVEIIGAYRLARAGHPDAGRLLESASGTYLGESAQEGWRSWIYDFAAHEILLANGPMTESGKRIPTVMEAALRAEDREPVAWFSWQLSRLCADRGQTESAIDHAGTALWLFKDLGREDMVQRARASLAMALVVSGDVAGAEHHLGAVGDAVLAPHAGWLGEIAQARAWAAAARGNLPRAHTLLRAAADEACGRADLIGESIVLHSLARLGDAGSSAERLRRLESRAPGPIISIRALHAEGIAGRDPEVLERCARRFEAVGALLVAVEAWAAAGAVWRERREWDRVTSAAEISTELRERCGPPAWLPDAMGPPSCGLSPAEQAVATLAVSGLSNPQIAEKLTLSRKTVENHLHRAYQKLGVTSRHQLAAGLPELCHRPG